MTEKETKSYEHLFFQNQHQLHWLCNTDKAPPGQAEQSKEIEHWHVDFNDPEHVLRIETNRMSPEQVKHYVRETGFEAEFTRAPEAR